MITSVQPFCQKVNTVTFQAKVPKNKLIVDCWNDKQVVMDKLIIKESKKVSVFESLKQMFFELFPKLDPEYKKIFERVDKTV